MIIDELITLLGFEGVDEAVAERYKQTVQDVTDQVVTLAKRTTVLTAALLGVVAITNKTTAKNDQLAKSINISSDALNGMSMVADDLGIGVDQAANLIEVMNKKIGSMANAGEEAKPVADAFKTLGLSIEDITKLPVEEQFIRISDAVQQLDNSQQALAAADKIFGGNADKFFGALRQGDESIGQIIQRVKQYNLLTEEAKKQAVAFNAGLSTLTFTVNTLRQEFSGIVGGSLVPLIKSMQDWIAANRELLQQQIREFAAAFVNVLGFLLGLLSALATILFAIVDLFGGWEAVSWLVIAAISALIAFKLGTWFLTLYGFITKAVLAFRSFNVILAITRVSLLATQAALFLIPIAIGAAILAVGVLIEDLIQFFTGGESVIGDFVTSIKNWFSGLPNIIKAALIAPFLPVIGLIKLITAAYQAFKSVFGIGDDTEVNANINKNVQASVNGTAAAAAAGSIAPTDVQGGGSMSSVDNSQKIEATIQVTGGSNGVQTGREIQQGLEQQARRTRRNATGAVAY